MHPTTFGAGDFAGRAARLAARMGTAHVAPDADVWAAWEARNARQQRAHAAQSSGRRRPLFTRELLPPPTYTKQFAPAGSTLAARDGRLVDGAVRLLDVIRALAGSDRVIERTTKAYLAKIVPAPSGNGRSERTIQRYLFALSDRPGGAGYLQTTNVLNERGAVIGLRIELTELARAAYECRDQAAAFDRARREWEALRKGQSIEFSAETKLSPIKGPNSLKPPFSTYPQAGIRPGRNAAWPFGAANAARGHPGG